MKRFVGSVKELWHYPVKSMAGRQIDAAHIEKLGMVGDRCWAVRDEENNEITTVRKIPKLMQCAAAYESMPKAGQLAGDLPQVNVEFPDGSCLSSDQLEAQQKLSEFVGREVSLQPLQPRTNINFYRLPEMSGEASLKKQFNVKEELPDLSAMSWLKVLELSVFATPLGRFHDVYPLHLLTSNSLEKLKSIAPEGDFNTRRFRPSIYIESHHKQPHLDEFDWVGGKLFIGDAIIKCECRTVRCLMPSIAQADLKKDSQIVRTLEKHTDRHLGIYASVIKQGDIKIGDEVYWDPEPIYSLRKFYQPVSNTLKQKMITSSLKSIDRKKKQ